MAAAREPGQNGPMNSSPGAERHQVWSAGIEPTIRLTRWRARPIRHRGLVLGAAAAAGVLAGVVTSWADISPVDPAPDTPLWIAAGGNGRLTEVRPRPAATRPAAAASERARVTMSELTVVPLTRPATAGRPVSPAASPSRSARTSPRTPADEPRAAAGKSSARKTSPAPKASASPSHPIRSGRPKDRSAEKPGHSDDKSATRSKPGKGKGSDSGRPDRGRSNPGHSNFKDRSGHGS